MWSTYSFTPKVYEICIVGSAHVIHPVMNTRLYMSAVYIRAIKSIDFRHTLEQLMLCNGRCLYLLFSSLKNRQNKAKHLRHFAG